MPAPATSGSGSTTAPAAQAGGRRKSRRQSRRHRRQSRRQQRQSRRQQRRH